MHRFKPLWPIANACLAAALWASGNAALAQSSDEGASNATIVEPITLTKVDDLVFGSIVAGDLAGTVTIDASTGAVSTTGEAAILGTARNRGRFIADAPLGAMFVLTGDPSVTLNRVGGGGTMVATLDYATGNGIGTIPLPPLRFVAILPTQQIDVGGTLAVGASQAPGDYEGTFSLTVLYL